MSSNVEVQQGSSSKCHQCTSQESDSEYSKHQRLENYHTEDMSIHDGKCCGHQAAVDDDQVKTTI